MNDLDELMSRDPLTLTKDDVRKLIRLQRQYRASREGGVRAPRRPTATAETAGLNLASLGLAPPKEPVKRRV